ncbi:DUF6507 family protein [Streptomyces sp. MS19]|uniref:DUF6507 family protein n=1 Tax=Streptomyces sp. MS19 TaxID=3385972 RepID=UPI0039A07F56
MHAGASLQGASSATMAHLDGGLAMTAEAQRNALTRSIRRASPGSAGISPSRSWITPR